MAEGKKAFVLYVDQKEIFEQLPDELAGQLIKHIFKYCNDENPETENIMLNLAFTPIKQQLKRDLKKYEDRAQRSRENGSKGGRPPKPKETQDNPEEPEKPSGLFENPEEPRKPDTDKDTVTVKEKVKDIESRKQAFTQSIFSEFDKEHSLNDLKEFCDYWTEHGEDDKKMRFEKETSFSKSKRLSRWMKNKDIFNQQPAKPKSKNTSSGLWQ